MSLRATRWLIELGPALLPEPLYLHVMDDESVDWSADKTRALRFRSKHEAEAYGYAELDCAFVASEQPTAELVGAPYHDIEAEADAFAH